MNAIERLKGAMVRVSTLVYIYEEHVNTTLNKIHFASTEATIGDLGILLDGLADRDISLKRPELKTQDDLSIDDRKIWVRGYDKGYKAGRDGEAERIKELVNKFWGL